MEDKDEILNQVKDNKKYRTISDEIVMQEIDNYLKKNPNERLNKSMIKEIRKNLHRLYSSYLRGDKNKRLKLLEGLRKDPNDLEIIRKILKTAASAKERLDDYPEIYQNIFEITKKPMTIIDLGCGLNPISIPFMGLDDLTYHAYDIDHEDIKFLNEFFKIKNIDGKAEILDAKNIDQIKKLPSSDIVFMFKLLDLINTKNDKPGEELIKVLMNKTRFIVASFATKTLGGRPMNLPRRKGFELMLKRNDLRFKTIDTRNEIFYIIEKSS